MKKIFIIQEQVQDGYWDVTGEAFLSEKKAQERINVLTSEALEEGHNINERYRLVIESDIQESSKQWFREMWDLGHYTFSSLLQEIEKENPGFLDCLAEDVQPGGFFSYETLKIQDWKKNAEC